jgi:hypothetical protein
MTVNVDFYMRHISGLSEHLREAIRSVCSTAADIERRIVDVESPDVLATVMEGLADEAQRASAFASSIYFLERLLREKTQA